MVLAIEREWMRDRDREWTRMKETEDWGGGEQEWKRDREREERVVGKKWKSGRGERVRSESEFWSS